MTGSRLRFFVIGAGRAGTTSLCHWLDSLPGVVMFDPKEPNYFCRDELYRKGLEWYEQLAPPRVDTVAIGEGSVLYSHRSYCPYTAERIARAYPDARIVYIARNPVSQVLSSWRYSFQSGHHVAPFTRALRVDPSYVERCDYAWQLEPYRRLFGPAQVHVDFFESFVHQPTVFLRNLCAFLGLTYPEHHAPPEKLNSSETILRPPRLLSRLRESPTFLRARQLLPSSVRAIASRSLSQRAPLPTDNAWTPEAHTWFVEQVGARARDFVLAQGKPVDYWNLALPSVERAS